MIDSRHVVSWYACISGLESWSASIWSIILVLLCQHSFDDVWSCFSICSSRLCVSFSLHHHWAYPRVSCMVTFCVWRWLLSYTGAYTHPWVHRIFCRFSHCSFYCLIFMGRHTGAYPHPWVHQIFCDFSHHLIHFLIFVSRYTGAYPFGAFLLGYTPSLWVYRVSCWFHGCRTHLPIFMSHHLGRPPTVILFRASPFCHLV